MKRIIIILLTLTPAATVLHAQDNPLWMRYPAISPDGQTILFSYNGDIYTVSSRGGQAIPLTISESYEFSPVWSHDGKWIAFASDRYGNFDVFVMPATGGTAKRLSYFSGNEIPSSFSGDDKSVLFSSLRQDLVTNAQFPGEMPQLFSVPVTGGRVAQVLAVAAPEPGDKWIKPSIVLIGEDDYSDAHLFPSAYKLKNIGKTLGMPVAGTGTFVWWEFQIDPKLYYGNPMGGWRTPEGYFEEGHQLEPDIKVRNEPELLTKGRDQQIEAAVRELMKKE